MILAFLFGCAPEDDCLVDEVEVADTDPVGDFTFTVAELLDLVEGARTFPASNRAGEVVPLELTITRGEGSAVLSDHTWNTKGGLGLLRLQGNDWDLNYCDDSVRVPVALALTSEAAGVDLVATTSATARMLLGTEADLNGVYLDSPETMTTAFTPPVAEGLDPEVRVEFWGGRLDRIELSWVAEGGHIRSLDWPPVAPVEAE